MTYMRLAEQLKKLMADDIHGASFIEQKLYSFFIKAGDSLDKAEYLRLVKLLDGWRTPMGNVIGAISAIRQSAQLPSRVRLIKLADASGDAIDSQTRLELRASRIISKFENMVTISRSSAVENAIALAGSRGWAGKVYVAESRPKNEGKAMAEALASLPWKYEIIYGTDVQIISLAKTADAALVGADLVAESYFVNKMGTRAMLAMLSKKVKLYVAAGLSKYQSIAKSRLGIFDQPPELIWKKPPRKVAIVNKYFEPVDFRPNLRFINEMGVWTAAGVKNYLEKNAARQ